MKKLRCWNGRGWGNAWSAQTRRNPDHVDHAYVCAESKAEAIRLLIQAGNPNASRSELNNFYSECWGRPMDGVTPEKGVWIQHSHIDKPIKIV